MKKRAAAVMIALIMLFSVTGFRMVNLISEPEQAANSYSSMTLDLATLKGTVYDCNMRLLTNSGTKLYAAAKPSGYGLGQLKGKVLPDVFDSVTERMSKGKCVAVEIDSHIAENDDIKEISVPDRYSDSLACHIIGYLDGEGNGVSGIEKGYNSLLSKHISRVTVRFESNARGRALMGGEISVEGNGIPKNGIVLTINKDIQSITEAALDASGCVRGAAVVIDVESGGIRACVSRPLFDRSDIAASLDDVNSPLINRALLPFSVGSVFKPVVAASALEKGVEVFEYCCTGSVTLNGVTFNCHKKEGHGVLDMQGAIADSCNTYFIALANETGGDEIIATAEKFGIGKEIVLADSVKSDSGVLPDVGELDSKAAVANLSFGQGSLTATPVQICAVFAAIARGGVYCKPYLAEGEVDCNGNFTRKKDYGERIQIISPRTADALCRYLKTVVTQGSGRRVQNDCVTAAGKTATAQTGKSKNGEEIYNAWFAGWFPADEPRYAVAILIEDGGEGAVSCAPVFREIAVNITKTLQNNSKK